MEINGTKKCIYLLDELLEINNIGQYSQSVVEMIIREITKKIGSYIKRNIYIIEACPYIVASYI